MKAASIQPVEKGLCVAWTLVALLASGCIAPRPRDAEGPAADAIEDATTISFAEERLPMLQKIAERDDLSQPVQLYLVNAICHAGPGGPQADALVTLIENPICTAETREYISKRLRFVTFNRDRRRVAEALAAKREEAPTQEP